MVNAVKRGPPKRVFPPPRKAKPSPPPAPVQGETGKAPAPDYFFYDGIRGILNDADTTDDTVDSSVGSAEQGEDADPDQAEVPKKSSCSVCWIVVIIFIAGLFFCGYSCCVRWKDAQKTQVAPQAADAAKPSVTDDTPSSSHGPPTQPASSQASGAEENPGVNPARVPVDPKKKRWLTICNKLAKHYDDTDLINHLVFKEWALEGYYPNDKFEKEVEYLIVNVLKDEYQRGKMLCVWPGPYLTSAKEKDYWIKAYQRDVANAELKQTSGIHNVIETVMKATGETAIVDESSQIQSIFKVQKPSPPYKIESIDNFKIRIMGAKEYLSYVKNLIAKAESYNINIPSVFGRRIEKRMLEKNLPANPDIFRREMNVITYLREEHRIRTSK